MHAYPLSLSPAPLRFNNTNDTLCVRLFYSPTALQRFPQQNGMQQSADEAKGDTAEHEVFDAQSLADTTR